MHDTVVNIGRDGFSDLKMSLVSIAFGSLSEVFLLVSDVLEALLVGGMHALRLLTCFAHAMVPALWIPITLSYMACPHR